MTLTNPEKCELRKQAHALKVVVQLGRHGLSDAVQTEIHKVLLARELIKIQVNAEDREERHALIQRIVKRQGAEVIQVIGHKVTLYRENPELHKPTTLTQTTSRSSKTSPSGRNTSKTRSAPRKQQ